MQQTRIRHATATSCSDELLARKLHDEINAEINAPIAPPSAEEDAASLSLALALSEQERRHAQEASQAQSQSAIDDDAALAAALAAADAPDSRVADDDEAASLALAIQLSEAPHRDVRRPVQNVESERLRRHLFTDGPASFGAYAPAAAPPPPPAIVGTGGPSFASVVGPPHPQQRVQAMPAAAHGAAARLAAPATLSTVAPLLRGGTGPQLIIDGANVAYSYGASRGFDAEGLVRCVGYFCERPSSGHTAAGARRLLPLSAIAVTLNESRYDPDDPALQRLEAAGVLSWTPLGKDDDVFLLQSAADHDAWVVTNDQWKDHRASRHATQEVRKRVLHYSFVGGAFTPASDDLAQFDASGRHEPRW